MSAQWRTVSGVTSRILAASDVRRGMSVMGSIDAWKPGNAAHMSARAYYLITREHFCVLINPCFAEDVAGRRSEF